MAAATTQRRHKMTIKEAQAALKKLTGEDAKLTRAPRRYGSAAFLDQTGRRKIAALFIFGRRVAWRLEDKDVWLEAA
jgi:hypothetical protein